MAEDRGPAAPEFIWHDIGGIAWRFHGNARIVGAALVTRFTDDNNVVWERNVRIAVARVPLKKAVCHLTDDWRTYTELPAEVCEDGSIVVSMAPCSFVLVEW